MSFLEDKCSLFPVVTSVEMEGFTCGDHDLDEFFTNDCFAYSKELLGKTYCFKMDENPQNVVCAFTLANADVRVSDLPNAKGTLCPMTIAEEDTNCFRPIVVQ